LLVGDGLGPLRSGRKFRRNKIAEGVNLEKLRRTGPMALVAQDRE
jgi:hypothetical protein